jgi:putative endonuclease
MITVFFLVSENDGATYVDMAIEAVKRLAEHNAGKNRYTKVHIPWEIMYTEKDENWSKARVREKYFKTAAGKRWLQKHINNTEDAQGFSA